MSLRRRLDKTTTGRRNDDDATMTTGASLTALLALLAAGCILSPDARLWQGRDAASFDQRTDRPRDQRAPDSSSSGADARADAGGADDGSAPDSVPVPDTTPACSWTGTVKLTPPVPLTAVNSSSADLEPILSADGLTLYFCSDRDGGDDSFIATRASRTAAFGAAIKNQEVSTSAGSETRFAPAASGLEAYLAAKRAGGLGGSDIWIATRASTATPFTPADFKLAAGLSSSVNEFDPYPSANGLRLYYIIQDLPSGLGSYDIVVASRASPTGAFSAPVALTVLNSALPDDNPALTADERVILFGSSRPGGPGSKDIYYAVRSGPSAAFSTPKPVPGINSTAADSELYITPDGCEVYFASTRPEGQGGWDIYHTRWIP